MNDRTTDNDPLLPLVYTDVEQHAYDRGVQAGKRELQPVIHLCGIHDTKFVDGWIRRLDEIEFQTEASSIAVLANEMQQWRERFDKSQGDTE